MSSNGHKTKSIKSETNSSYTVHSLDQQQASICDNLQQAKFELEPVHLQFSLSNKLNKLLVSSNIMYILLTNVVYKIDLDNPSQVENYALPGKVTNAWLNPNGQTLIVQIEKQAYYTLEKKVFKLLKFKNIEVTSIAFSNHNMVVGTKDGIIYVYEKSLKQVYKVDSPVQGVMFSNDYSQINVLANSLYTWDCFDISYVELQKVFKQTTPVIKSINPPGIFTSNPQNYVYISSDNEIITNDEEIQLDRVDGEFSQIALTSHHLIGIEGNSLKIYNKLNKQLQELSLSENKIRGIAVDNLFNTYWVYTKNSVYEFVIENESISVWYDYYKMGKYSEALKYLDEDDEANFSKRDLVLIKQGYDYLQRGGFGISSDDLSLQIQGIQILAKSTEPFEKVCLMLLNHKESDVLLIEYLLAKLNKKNKVRMVVLSAWIIELMVRNYDSRVYEFIKTNYKLLDRPTMYQILNSEKLIFYAELIEDYNFILKYYIDKKNWALAVKTLIKLYTKGDIELVYENATILLMNYPKVTETWLKLDLEYEKLLPALLKHQEQAIHFLQQVIMDKHYKKNKQLNNAYLCLLITKPGTDKQIIKFINFTSNFDTNFILRLCISHEKFHPAVLIYIEIGLFDQALELALKHDLTSLAEFILNKYDEDKQVEGIKLEDANYNVKRKLWLKFAKYLIDKSDDLNETLHHVINVSMLDLKDLLPLFPETVSINNFKDEIVESLNEYNKRIVHLSLDMNNSSEHLREMKKKVIYNKKKTNVAIIEPGEPCRKCGKLLVQENFVYFLNCHHAFHKECMKKNQCLLCNDFLNL
ncbi:conserved hypothetical protein [Candida albicans WO-1]|uniref:Pep3/Vps18 beta-propeller domain-containing protein n=1 Tax=Candida albicans (strain WO-1) TaxID=294748 RepID=C4YSM9_CANAW|nr:conserved hypothetical protein [Candida albicans WO-1]